MNRDFLSNEWELLNNRLRRCAEMIAQSDAERDEFRQQAETFANLSPPERYPELLERTAEAAGMANRWRDSVASEDADTESKQDNQDNQGSQDSEDAESSERAERAKAQHEQEMLDETLDESFPASDPPSFSHGHA